MRLTDRYLRIENGRVFLDKCETTQQHLTLPAEEGKERPGCRVYLEDLLKHFEGEKVDLEVMKDVHGRMIIGVRRTS